MRFLIMSGCAALFCCCACAAAPGFSGMAFSFEAAEGLGPEAGVSRRDPSDVIRVDGLNHVWYTKIVKSAALYPSGYNGTVWHATSKDGQTWTEQAMAVGLSESGFDSFGVFTPNILPFEGKFYLYYTAVAKGFVNEGYQEIGKTAIGVAVADAPDGPWKKEPDPVLTPNTDHARFDSFRTDDACMMVRGGKVWMYYKGRQWEHTPRETKMGVAVAEHPTGPFTRLNAGRYVQDSGHEVLVWPYAGGVMSLASRTGPHGGTAQFAEDGLQFAVVQRLEGTLPKAPGAFRADLSGRPDYDGGIEWGIAHEGRPPYLVRFSVISPKQ